MKQKLMLGGIGGLTPLFASLLVLDVSALDSYIRQMFDSHTRGDLYLLGYTAKALLLFAVGALWAYLHRSEPNALKIYQLGIVAPAILVGLINSAEIRSLTPKGSVDKRITSADVSPTVSLLPTLAELSPPVKQQTLGEPYLASWLAGPAQAEAACPDGTCAAADGSCSRAACPPSWLDKFTSGFLSRPAPKVVSCDELPVTASIPYASSVMVNIQHGPARRCTFSVDGATSESGIVISCTKVNAHLAVPKGYSAARTETSDSCVFSVHGWK